MTKVPDMTRLACRLVVLAVSLLFVTAAIGTAWAEEGMWTFDNLPVRQLQKKYGFVPSAAWLEKVRLASVRFNDGGSGSFVSPDGLVLTNHHVALGQLQKMSTPQKDFVKDGFYARTPAEEIKCVDLELNVLVDMVNVTGTVEKAARGLSDQAALEARKRVIAAIEQQSTKMTGLRSDVVSLYQGGEYWLYTYKKYRDVRLVMAPERQIAFFGGDADNFTYPRYNLDFAIFRVYENDRPVQPKHYLRFNPKGAGNGELVFVSGHPGSTARDLTMSQLLFMRDVSLPARIQDTRRLLRLLESWSRGGAEQKRRAGGFIYRYQNRLKVLEGQAQGLRDASLVATVRKRENALQAAVRKNPALQREVGSAWADVARAQEMRRTRYLSLSHHDVGGLRLPRLAMAIVLYVKETRKPDGKRLAGYHEAQLEGWRFRNLSAAPVYLDLEELLLADSLQEALAKLGPKDRFVQVLLGGKSPRQRARELIGGTRLQEVTTRKALLGGGEAGLKASRDPLIRLALQLEPLVRQDTRWEEDHVSSVVTRASEKIARARFRVYGRSTYPDATFTLRLSYGTVRGYPMNGTVAPWKTTFYGLYDRSLGFDGQGDWALPARYLERQKDVDLPTPFNFVTTNDVIGGNSGSPVVNRTGELVGLVFDGNIESLVGDFIYVPENNRTLSVHPAAIIMALRRLYDAGALADELTR